MPIVMQQPGFRLMSGDDINGNFGTLAGGSGYTTQNNIVARAGGGQANATSLSACISRITTVATSGDSVALPLATGGQSITVINAAGNAMQLFANVGGTDTINGTAGSTGISIAAGKTMELVSFPGVWHGLLSA